jgi:hypothetical protein
MKNFTPDALAVAQKAKEFAKDMNYADVGRESLLLGFASENVGQIIKDAFERCGLSLDAIRAAIVYIDGPQRVVKQHPVKFTHHDLSLRMPDSGGFEAITANQHFPWMKPNADIVFTMAMQELTNGNKVTAFDVLRIFLREVGRSDQIGESERRVMQVIHRAVPGLSLADITSAVEAAFDDAIVSGELAIDELKGARHSFVYRGHPQNA